MRTSVRPEEFTTKAWSVAELIPVSPHDKKDDRKVVLFSFAEVGSRTWFEPKHSEAQRLKGVNLSLSAESLKALKALSFRGFLFVGDKAGEICGRPYCCGIIAGFENLVLIHLPCFRRLYSPSWRNFSILRTPLTSGSLRAQVCQLPPSFFCKWFGEFCKTANYNIIFEWNMFLLIWV